MTRNTTRRVEVAAPILDPALRERIIGDFETYLSDGVKARVQNRGEYLHRTGETGMNAQEFFYERAYNSQGR